MPSKKFAPRRFARPTWTIGIAVAWLASGIALAQAPAPVMDRNSAGFVRYWAAAPGQVLTQPGVAKALPERAAVEFLLTHKSEFGIVSDNVDFAIVKASADDNGLHVRLGQTYKGVPVYGAEAIVQLDRTGAIVCVLSDLSAACSALDLTPDIATPQLDAAAASARALEHVRAQNAAQDPVVTNTPSLVWFDPLVVGLTGNARLAWSVDTATTSNADAATTALIDAKDGSVAFETSQLFRLRDRQVYDANNTGSDPGTLARSEGAPATGTAEVDHAYLYLGDMYNFFLFKHGRDSVDGVGLPLSATVRYSPAAAEGAYWSHANHRFYFYDGFAAADDVVGHEYVQGIIEFDANLIYFGLSGAISESLSDMWGEFMDQTNAAGSDTADKRWLIGEDLPPAIGAVRNMANPPAFSSVLGGVTIAQPDRYDSSDFYYGLDDDGGVHHNSGVLNKLAYLLVDGDTFNGQIITGWGIDKVSALYYEAETNLLLRGADFTDFYNALRQAAINLHYTQADCANIENACEAVALVPFPEPASWLRVTDSISPTTDHRIPFLPTDSVTPRSRVAQLLLTNTGPAPLVVSNIALLCPGAYDEDLGDGLAQDWTGDTPANWTVQTGQFRAKNLAATNDFMTARYTAQSWTDLSVEATLTRIGSESPAAGIALRATDDFDYGVGAGAAAGSAYIFQVAKVSGNYTFAVAKCVNGTVTALLNANNVVHPIITSLTTANTLRATAVGNTLKFEVNGVTVWIGTDSAIAGPGRIALVGYTQAIPTPTEHHFDDIHVSAPGVAGAAFSLTNATPMAIPSGEAMSIGVMFQPPAAGDFTSPIVIASNDPAAPRVEVTLSGTGAADADNDGLPDAEEITQGTEPAVADTDGDGLNDGVEVYTYGTDPKVDDTDSDTLTDGDEVTRGTDPLSTDSDGDTLPDGWEVTYSLNPLDATGNNGANGDPDTDTLTNATERTLGTNPRNADTDGDALPDDWEVAHTFNPLSIVGDDGADGDPDGDNLKNSDEYASGTNPRNAHSDADALPDGWEVLYALNPLDATGDNGASGDPDSDSLSNSAEFANGTNPKLADTDSDTLPDGWEVTHTLSPIVSTGDDGADGDPDADNLVNSAELAHGTDPRNADSDDDQLPDGWEVDHLLDPMSNVGDDGSDGDPDDDNLNNVGEYDHGTDPHNPDTDGGGQNDGTEVASGRNPLDRNDDYPYDIDSDGRVDALDIQLTINGALRIPVPYNTDVTGDGTTDALDVQYVINAALRII